jgi:hypothetical protein
MLKIENLQVSVDGKKIVNGLDLEVNAGEVHAATVTCWPSRRKSAPTRECFLGSSTRSRSRA